MLKIITPLSTTLLLIFSLTARADSFIEKCIDISACAKTVSELLGQKYLFDTEVKGKILATPNLDINRENAELLFTDMLNLNGYSRVPLGQPNTFKILRQREARDSALPLFNSDQKTAPLLPNNWDLCTLRYKATYGQIVDHIARMSRSFMPANSRIIPDEISGTLLITDTAINLNKLYLIIKDMDQKPSAELKKRMDEQAKIKMAELKLNSKPESKTESAPVKHE